MKKISTLLFFLLISVAGFSQWQTMATLPVTLRQHCAVGASNGKLYVFNGWSSDNALRNTLYIYDAATNTWSSGPNNTYTSRGSAYTLGTDGKVYCLEGLSSTCSSYDPSTNAWSSIASAPNGGWEGAAASYNNKIYVFGGEGCETTLSIYNIATNSWSSGASVPIGVIQHQAVTANNKIYLFGGLNSNTPTNAVQIYDPVANTWSTGANMPTAQGEFGAAVTFDGLVYIIGGKTSYFNDSPPFFNTVYIYNTLTNSWTSGNVIPTALGENAASYVPGFGIYTTGGTNTVALNNVYFQPYSANSIATSTITGPFCAGAATSVSFTASGTFTAGNIFTAQLSDASGSFSSPVNIGTLTATASGTISVVIPSGTTAGTGYRIRVISSTPAVTGSDNGSNITVNALPVPTLTGSASVCVTSTGNVYTTQTGMTGYTWSVSAGGTVTAGGTAASNTVTVTWTTTGAKTVSVSYTNASGCTAAMPTVYNVTVNALPVPTITGPASVCATSTGNVYTTQAGMTGYTWSVSAGGTVTAGGTAASNTVTVTWNTIGAQTVSVNYTNASGCVAAAPTVYNVTVNALPVPTITGAASVCVNSTGNVYTTQTGMTGYTWSVSAGGTITSGGTGTSNTVTVTWTTAGARTVSVNYTNANGCTAANPVVYNVTVNPLPVPTITGPVSVCATSTGNVYTTQAGMTGYTWSVSAGGTVTAGGTAASNTVTVTWNTIGAQTVSVNYTNANGCVAATPTVYNVTVNALPVPTITGPVSVCATSTGNVYTTQAGMTGYTWSVSAGGSVTAGGTAASNTVTVTWNTIGAQTVSVNYTNANGCVAAAPTVYNVTVNALPVPTITGAASVCVNSTGNVYTTQAGMTNYAWSVSAGGTITSGGTATSNTATVTWTTSGTKTVSVNYTNAGGCSAATATIYNVTVNPLPAPTIAGPAAVCATSTGNVYTTQAGMTGYTWSVSAGGSITAGAGTNAVTVTWNTAGAQTVTVNYTNGNGCTAAAPVTYNVTVNPLPAPTITGTATLCSGLSATYTTQAGMTNYVWSISAGGVITAGGTATSNTVTVNWVNAGAQTVSVNYTNSSGCTAGTATVYNVTVNPTPTPIINAFNTPCAGSTPVDYYTDLGMTNYVWTVSAGATIVSGQGTYHMQATWSVPGPGTVSVVYTNPTGCTSSTPGTYPVSVNAMPATPGTITGTAAVCAGAQGIAYSVPLVSFANSYVWVLPAGATIATGAGTNSITVNFSASAVSGNISVAGNNDCGNGPFSPNFPVTVTPMPAAAGTINGPATVCAPSAGNVYSVPAIANATSYSWTLPSGATIASGANTASITVTYSASAVSGNITVAGSNSCGNGTVSPSYAVTVHPAPATPVVVNTGDTLASSASTGNQWYYSSTQGGTGSIIPGATGQTYLATATGWYWSVVTLNGCSSQPSNKVYIVMVGVQELSSGTFNIYPVPNHGEFTVNIATDSQEAFTLSIYNNVGMKIYELPGLLVNGTLQKTIDLRPVPDGIYIVTFTGNSGSVVRRIVITK